VNPVVVPADFLDVGSREAVDIVLHRLAKKGTIRRLSRGVYDFPKEHPVLGPLQPSTELIGEDARLVGSKTGAKAAGEQHRAAADEPYQDLTPLVSQMRTEGKSYRASHLNLMILGTQHEGATPGLQHKS
jgi:hypothetical protein